ncbi:sigma 54-interacting transcriptional regulator [Clostridium ganghwense]|uniref:Sigma 54-interacting transcriptional regulator n=1 Tax=Clostridium ganghwense TaxID=312089 RepID=A0ABT4CLY1_9CLOT|nr:sigma 54-interacting transcriptional regulator [Clostridium ganghwense]MCY6370052.1 sigma 54-interacting transcriptional regulator [Clostridium ganghwense]
MSLTDIKASAQEVAEAIAAVLHVDVTIVDKNSNRIAATGEYKGCIGEKIPQKSLFEFVISEKKPKHINKSHSNTICKNCSKKSTCSEFASIGYPILNGNEVIGVIGINSFREEQKKIIEENYDSLMVFLEKLSTILLGNMIYNQTIKQLKIQTEETSHIIDSLSYGILCVNSKGMIKYINKKAKKLFGISDEKIINHSVKDIIPDIDIELIREKYHGKKINIHGKGYNLMLKNNPIIFEGEEVSNIIEVSKTSEEVRNAYNLITGEKVVKFQDIIGQSESVKNVKDISKNIAKSNSTVLLRGESGTGKELFARAIHYDSDRYKAPFIAINCASIPDNLLESELFGYEGGAFSGARREGQMGKFELANGGTIFLDEIGDMPIHLQPKILRVLQEQKFRRIGGKKEISVNVRVIAATNRNLEEMVKNRLFRDDLYYRLNVIPIFLPSLKERGMDILLLSEHLLQKFCDRLETGNKKFSKEIQDIFISYNWPGNIRELENVIEYLVNVTKEELITPPNLPIMMKQNLCEFESQNKMTLKSRLERYEKNVLISLIEKHGNDAKGKEKITEELEIEISTLYRKLKKYNLQK